MLDELKARGAPVSVAEDAANQFSAKYDNEQPGILQSIGKGAESFGTGLLTGLGKFADDNKGLLGDTAGLTIGQMPGSPISQSITSALPSAGDATKAAGLQPGMASSIGSAIGRTAPYFAAPEAGLESILGRIGGQAARGAMAGAQTSQDGDKLEGAALGAATAGAGEGLLSAVGKGAQSVGKAISKNIYQPLVNKLEGPMQDIAKTNLNQGAQTLKSIYDAKKIANNNDWSTAESLAEQLGNTPFNNADYLKALENEKDSINKEIGDGKNIGPLQEQPSEGAKSNLQAKYSKALSKLDGFIDQAPSNFRDAMRVRKDINAAKDSVTNTSGLATDPEVNKAAGAAREALVSQFDSNLKNAPAMLSKKPTMEAFGDAWTNANQGYKNLQQYKMAPKAGTLSNSINLNKAMNGDPEGKIFNDFIPSGKNDTGTAKFEHLANLLGDKDQANDLIKSAIFNKSLEGGFNPDSLLSKYKSLSPDQRSYLFTSAEKSNLDNALQAKNLGQNSKAANSIGQTIFHHSLSAGLGAALAHQAGVNPWIGVSIGALGGNTLKRGAGSIAEQIGMNNPERYIGLAKQAPQFNKTSSILNALTSAGLTGVRNG